MPTNTKLQIRLAGPSDLGGIGRLLPELAGPHYGERFPGGTVADFCRWKYFGNPFGDAVVGIATDDGRVVSLVAAVPKRVQLKSKIVAAFELGDFITDPTYRKRGLFTTLVQLVCDEALSRSAAFAYVRPNPSSRRLLVPALSFLDAGKIDSRLYVVSSRLLQHKTGVTASFWRAAGVDMLLRQLVLPRTHNSVVVTRAARFGDDINELCERLRGRYSFALVRDREYLNWRYADCPTPYVLWIAHHNGYPAGFLVQFVNHAEETGYIVDLFTDPTDEETSASLLRVSIESMLQEADVRSIHTWTLGSGADSAGTRLMKRSCPFVLKPHLHLAMKALSGQAEESWLPSDGWQLTMGDFDGI